MGGPAPETRRSRRRMVVSQLANRGIRDRRVLAAMAWAPREWFLPPHLARDAYEDARLPLGSGQPISQPLIVALMTEALAPRRGDRVLEIGTGSGYQTAILTHLGARVYTIERLPDLLVEAEERFRRLGLRSIETRLGDGAGGWPEHAPFDRIIVTAAAPGIPTPLTEQLAPGGRLVIPVGDLSGQGHPRRGLPRQLPHQPRVARRSAAREKRRRLHRRADALPRARDSLGRVAPGQLHRRPGRRARAQRRRVRPLSRGGAGRRRRAHRGDGGERDRAGEDLRGAGGAAARPAGGPAGASGVLPRHGASARGGV